MVAPSVHNALESAPAMEQRVATPSSVDLFVEALPSVVSRAELECAYRRTQRGLFVTEPTLPKLVEYYATWIEKALSGTAHKSIDKYRRRLLGGDRPKTVYIFDGKQSVPGYLIPCAATAASAIPQYKDLPVDATTYLHPRDPVLQQIEGLDVQVGSSGLEFAVARADSSRVVFDLATLSNFFRLVRRSFALRRRFPSASHSVREALKALTDLLHGSRPIARDRFFVLPLDTIKRRELRCFINGGFAFIADRNQRVQMMYETRGGGLWDFLVGQIRELEHSPYLKKISALRVRMPSLRAKFVAELKTPSRSYQLERSALVHFIEGMPALKPPEQICFEPITLRDVFELLIWLFEEASNSPNRERRGKWEQRFTRNLTISVDTKRGVVTDFRIAGADSRRPHRKR